MNSHSSHNGQKWYFENPEIDIAIKAIPQVIQKMLYLSAIQ